MSVEIWVHRLGEYGNRNDPPRPDIPGMQDPIDGTGGIPFTSDACAPPDMIDNKFFAGGVNIIVDEKDLPAINKHLAEQHQPEAVPFADGPERDTLLVSMIRTCRDDYDRKADAYFDSIPNMTTATAARKRMVKDILLQARARGLSAEKAEEIRLRHKLPVSKMVEV